MKNINRFGELYFNKDEALITMPFNRLNVEEVEILEENYRNKAKEIGRPDNFIYANHFSSIRDRLQMSFDLNGCVDFHNIRNYQLKDMLPFLYSLVDLARLDINVLWQKSNLVVDLTEKRVKAILFEFDGFNIYKKDNNLDGLKEAILLALTKNNSIIAKPKRADFIQKSDDVYQFSDDVLAANTIDDIESVIQSYQREVEYQELKDAQEHEDKKQNSFFYKAKSKMKPNKKEKEPDQELKEQLLNESENQGNNNKNNNKGFLDKITSPVPMISIVGGLIVVVLFFSIADLPGSASGKDNKEHKLEQQEKVLKAYRLYINGDEDQKNQAYAKLDSVGYDNLPQKDQNTLIDWYIEQEKFTKALNLDPDSAYKISDHIVKQNRDRADNSDEAKELILSELQQLENSFPNNNVLSFDIARFEGNNQAVIENSHLSKYNDTRAKSAVKAYAVTNQTDALDDLLDEYKNDESSQNALRNQYDKNLDKFNRKNELEDKIDDLQEKVKKKQDKKDNADDEDKKDDLKSDIKDLKDDIDNKKDKLKNVNDSLTNDD